MSGPKTSRYSLSEAQRRLIIEQLKREAELRAKEEQKRIQFNNSKSSAKRKITDCKEAISNIDVIIKEILEIPDNKANITDIRTEADRIKDDIGKLSLKLEAATSIKDAEDVKTDATKLLSSINVIIRSSQDKANEIKEEYRDELLTNISKGFSVSFANIANKRKLKENEYFNLIQDAIEEIKDLDIPLHLQKKMDEIKEKANEIKDEGFLKNFYAISIVPFVKECKSYIELYKQYGEEYETLLGRYIFLAKELNKDTTYIPFSKEAISILLDKISELEKEQLEQKEKEYIAQCIDEAMEEMGYALSGHREVEKKSGKKFSNKLYKFDEGTAVCVTCSSDGQITMELGLVDVEDRLPTDTESSDLEEDMASFCDGYKKIEEKLREKGIEPKRIQVLPPDAQYAQVINVSDYDITNDIGDRTAKRRKRKIEEKKVIRNE